MLDRLIGGLFEVLGKIFRWIVLFLLIIAEMLLFIQEHAFFGSLAALWGLILHGNFDVVTLGSTGATIFVAVHLYYLLTGNWELVANICLWIGEFILLSTVGFAWKQIGPIISWTASSQHHPAALGMSGATVIITLYCIMWLGRRVEDRF